MIGVEQLSILESSLNRPIPSHTIIWIQAFKEYNDSPTKEKNMSMNCRPCYYKVYMWHKKRIENGL